MECLCLHIYVQDQSLLESGLILFTKLGKCHCKWYYFKKLQNRFELTTTDLLGHETCILLVVLMVITMLYRLMDIRKSWDTGKGIVVQVRFPMPRSTIGAGLPHVVRAGHS